MHPKRKQHPQGKCPKVKDKQLNAMVKSAWAAGWWAIKLPNGHVMCYSPDLAAKVLVNNSAGDPHVIRRIRGYFHKAGLKL